MPVKEKVLEIIEKNQKRISFLQVNIEDYEENIRSNVQSKERSEEDIRELQELATWLQDKLKEDLPPAEDTGMGNNKTGEILGNNGIRKLK